MIKLVVQITIIFGLFFNSSALIFSQQEDSTLISATLAPANRSSNLDIALKQIKHLKGSVLKKPMHFLPHKGETDNEDKLFKTPYQIISHNIYRNYRLGSRPFKERILFVKEVFSKKGILENEDNETYLKSLEEVGEELNKLIFEIDKNYDKYLVNDRLTAEGRNLIEKWEYAHQAGRTFDGRKKFTFKQKVAFSLAMQWFLFDLSKDRAGKYNELYALEMEKMTKELFKEKNNPGAGDLPSWIFITDIHGGEARLLSLVAYSFGIKEYNELKNLSDLQKALVKNKIVKENSDGTYTLIKQPNTRFIGFSDKMDRGLKAMEVSRITDWLHDENTMLDFLSGNHEGWHSGAGVIMMHMLYPELVEFDSETKKYKWIGPKEEVNHHIACWSWETMNHSGWVTNTIDEINEDRINNLINWLNSEYDTNIDSIEILKYRIGAQGPEKWLKELKKRNNVIREGDGEGNEHRGSKLLNTLNDLLEEGSQEKFSVLKNRFFDVKNKGESVYDLLMKNLEECKIVYTHFSAVYDDLQNLLREDKENVELKIDQALLKLEDNKNAEELLYWVKKYALGDGSLKDAVSFFNKVQEKAYNVFNTPVDQLTIIDVTELIAQFNELYPLTDILEVTLEFLNKEFSKRFEDLDSTIDKKIKSHLKTELARNIKNHLKEAENHLDKSKVIIKQKIKELFWRERISEEEKNEYLKVLETDYNVGKKELQAKENRSIAVINRGDINEMISYHYNDQLKLDMYLYPYDLEVRARALTDNKRFKLLRIDAYGNMHRHSMISVKKNINDKGEEVYTPDVNFRGRTGHKAITSMEMAIRMFYSEMDILPKLSEESLLFTDMVDKDIGDGIKEFNSWYSERTNFAKAPFLNKMLGKSNSGHFFDIAAEEGVGLNNGRKPLIYFDHNKDYSGHNPPEKREQGRIRRPYNYGSMVNNDTGLSTGYKERGAMIVIGAYGFKRFGFKSSKSKTIEDITNIAYFDKNDKVVTFEEVANDKNDPNQEMAKLFLKEQDKEYMLNTRIIASVDALMNEYQGLLEYAKKDRYQSHKIKLFEKKLADLKDIFEGELIEIPDSSELEHSA